MNILVKIASVFAAQIEFEFYYDQQYTAFIGKEVIQYSSLLGILIQYSSPGSIWIKFVMSGEDVFMLDGAFQFWNWLLLVAFGTFEASRKNAKMIYKKKK